MMGPRLATLSRGILAVAMTLVLATSAAAQSPRVRTALDTTLVKVGDQLHLTVTVEHAQGETVVWPDSLSLMPFEILGAEMLPPTESQGRVVSSARMVLTVFELGDLELPSFELFVARPDGASVPLSTDSYLVTVESVGLDEGGDIRAIRGPLGIPFAVIYVLPWLLLLVAICALGIWWWRRRRPADASEGRSVIIPPLPHEEAYRALDRLEGSSLLERGEIKEYHIEVSEIIRTYIEGRFDVFALEMTTGEVLDGLERVEVDEAVVASFAAFLNRCDMVKFAKLRPEPEACREILAVARGLVDRTRPQVPAPVDSTPAGEVEEPIGVEEPILEAAGAGER